MRTFRVIIIALMAAGVLAACALPHPHETGSQSVDEERTTTPSQVLAPATTAPKEQTPAPGVATLPPEHAPARIQGRMAALTADTVDPLPSSETGYYMDLQEASLRKAMQGVKIDIVRRANRLVLTLAGELGFATGKARLPPEANEALAALAPVLVQYPKTFLAIHDYTDPSGSARYNRQLSKQRSLHFARRLVAEGVAPARIVAIGHGETDSGSAAAPSHDDRPSRRLELHLLPLVR